MEYEETLQLIAKVSEYGSVMGLDSIRELMERLGSPEEQLKIIHVAGTNGKGSTCAFLSSILMECGYTVGRFSTPDVFCYEEKFQINGKNMSREDLGIYYERVETICQQIAVESMPHPTLFEMETAIAVCYAVDRNCDYLLLEVGMGGKTDATNYIKEPLVSVLTSVSMDHTEYLGNTLEEIARMKAGIIKKSRPVVSAWQEKPVREIFEKEAAKQNCPFYYIPEEKFKDGQCFCWNGMTVTLPVTMQACYQVQNAMTALQTIDVIKEYDKEVIDRAADLKTADIKTGKPAVKITPECILAGIKKAVSPGRFMKILDQPEFYIDGAHNPGAAAELVKTLRFRFQDYSKVFIIGVFKDKDYDGMLRILSNIEAKIITAPLPPPRGLSAELLAQAAKKYYSDVYCANSISEAVEKAIEYAGEAEKAIEYVRAAENSVRNESGGENESGGRKGMILAFGSLSYLKEVAGTIKNITQKKQ